MRHPALLKRADEILRQIDRKRQIVFRVHEQRLPIVDAISAYNWLALRDWVDVYY